MPRPPVLLYLHIPKVGGTTLSNCIHYHCGAAEPHKAEADPDYPGTYMFHEGVYYFWKGFFKEPDLAVPEYVRRALAREDLRAVVGHFWFGFHQYVRGPWAYATMLRDPVERTVSLYAHLVEHGFPRPLPYGGMSLREFATNPPFREVDNDQTRRLAGEEPELGRCTRAMLGRAKENLRRHFRVVGVTERFDETLMLLKAAFGWTQSLRYYPRNQTRDRPATSSLPPDTADAIRGRNELDLELYRFAQELLEDAVASRGAAFRDELASFQASQREWLADVARQAAAGTP
jgi:hypothetical protein